MWIFVGFIKSYMEIKQRETKEHLAAASVAVLIGGIIAMVFLSFMLFSCTTPKQTTIPSQKIDTIPEPSYPIRMPVNQIRPDTVLLHKNKKQ